ncbi:MAG: tagatose-6-phosphate ketose isomerase, partial [Terriglobales bacterium]
MNSLAKILDLSTEEKVERGLLYTPAEIAQQPATWESTFSLFKKHRTGLAAFLVKAGFGDSAG